jgi:high affinity Mn2+ porin
MPNSNNPAAVRRSMRALRPLLVRTAASIGALALVPAPGVAQKAAIAFGVPAAVEAAAAFLPGDWSTHYQYTAIDQGHPGFQSPYSGPNSLNSGNRMNETMSATAYLGRTLGEGSALYLDPEFVQGFGLSHTTGLGGFANGEAQKAGEHAPKLYIPRFYLQQTIGLGGEQEKVEDDLNQVAGSRDISRITIYAGKLAVNDLFDNNAYAHDNRNDFMNWAVWEGGAYDYAADVRGYSDGIAAELNQREWAFRLGGFLIDKRSNSRELDTQFLKRGGYQAEIEARYTLFDQAGKLRLLGFANRSFSGSYRAALATPGIDITVSRKDRIKEGFVVNLEQAISDDLGAFGRFSFNDGHTEIMSFTDIDRSSQIGLSLKGSSWGRADDRIGIAAVVNGLSGIHADFLKAGGLGILVGDGRLNYATEDLLEAYYRFQISQPISLTANYQFVLHPAYNQDRGPVSILALRLHLQY